MKSRIALSMALLASLTATHVAAAEPEKYISAKVENRSEPVLCAEKDNIELNFISPEVKRFRLQAVHPAFIGMIVADKWAPDFTSCDMTNDPVFAAQAKRITFFETPDMWLTGYAYPSFWRPASVPVRVGNRVETGLHVVQLWVRHQERAEEVMAFYPPDGYWRARPLPPAHLRWTAYGSSFLVGPVETQGRPIVDLKEIAFDPDTRTFTLSFKRGGSATMKIETLDPDRLILEVDMKDVPKDRPFASVRSMYATEFNSDAARVAWREEKNERWGEAHVMDFKGANATEFWVGRTTASRHNTSAPDMVIGHFGK